MKRWLKYVSPYKKSFILGPLGMIVEVIGEMFMPLLLALIINRATEGTLEIVDSILISLLLIGIVAFMMTGGIFGA